MSWGGTISNDSPLHSSSAMVSPATSEGPGVRVKTEIVARWEVAHQ